MSDVVFRRINGRVVPIRSKDEDRKEKKSFGDRLISRVDRSLVTGGAIGGAVYGQGKLAEKFFTREIGKITNDISGIKATKPKPFKRDLPDPEKNWGDDSPLGKMAQDKFKKEQKNYNQALKRYLENQNKYMNHFSRKKSLRYSRMQFSKYRMILNKNLLRASVGAAALGAGMDLAYSSITGE